MSVETIDPTDTQLDEAAQKLGLTRGPNSQRNSDNFRVRRRTLGQLQIIPLIQVTTTRFPFYMMKMTGETKIKLLYADQQ